MLIISVIILYLDYYPGKRYNVLRNRIDSWEYDMDQLLFGTILFTLLAFLFPTVLVYYALFATVGSCLRLLIDCSCPAKARFIILLLLASMEFLLTLVNHFPLFALMLSVKDAWRLPSWCDARWAAPMLIHP